MGEPPFSVTFQPGHGKGASVRATLTLRNAAAAPRWFALRAKLDMPLAEAFDAQLVQLCSFEGAPTLRYVQALGVETGCVAFWLGAGASIALEGFALRSHGGPTAFEVWEVEAMRAGDQPVQACFPVLQPAEGAVRVTEAFKRSTEGTHPEKPCPVLLDCLARWTVATDSGRGADLG